MMRELKECKAEVFRRSEQRIKARKKQRTRVLAWSIPLCLCAVLWSALILPAMPPAESEDMALNDSMEAPQAGFEDYNDMLAGSSGSLVCSYVRVEIQNTGKSAETRSITDKAAVTRIFSAIHSLFPGGGIVLEGTPEQDMEYAVDHKQENTGTKTDYTVIFETEDGSQTVYTLSGNQLVNTETEETLTLSGSQLKELLTALGIAE